MEVYPLSKRAAQTSLLTGSYTLFSTSLSTHTHCFSLSIPKHRRHIPILAQSIFFITNYLMQENLRLNPTYTYPTIHKLHQKQRHTLQVFNYFYATNKERPCNLILLLKHSRLKWHATLNPLMKGKLHPINAHANEHFNASK